MLILCEITNGFNGVLLGANLFGDIPVGWLLAAMILLISFMAFVQVGTKSWNSTSGYGFKRLCLLTAFLGNFLLFCLLGGIRDERFQPSYSSASVLGNRQTTAVGDTLPPAYILRPNSAPIRPTAVLSDSQQGSRRAGYIVLGLLGIVLTLFVAGLACSIACAGYGSLSLLVLAFGLGAWLARLIFSDGQLKSP